MKEDKSTLSILRKISQEPQASQRKMAITLGYSIGKLNYCLKALQKKGLIKIKNFKKNPNKLNYLYIITPKGVAEKTRMTIEYMGRISQEYDELKKDLNKKK
jgi:EPS-associated MarR family transcriptional regulator